MIKRVYLDTNHWIKLAQIANGKENDPEYKKIYEKIRQLSDSGTVIFPISMASVHEFASHSDQKKREEMIDLLVDISKGWFLQPVTLFFEKEIENAIMHRIKKDYLYDINQEIVQKGLSYFAGLDFEQFMKNKNPPPEFMDKLRSSFKEFNEDLETIRMNLKDPKIVKISLDALQANQELILILEKNRKKRRELDKSLRKRFSEASSICDLVVPHMSRFVLSNNIPPKDVLDSSQNLDVIRAFVEDMPALNVFCKLAYARDEVSPERPIRTNDHWDLVHFSGAIPYCDVLVTEKMFAGLSKQLKLDEKYNCIILTNLKDLHKIEFFN